MSFNPPRLRPQDKAPVLINRQRLLCDCPDHLLGAPWTIDGHRFERETKETPDDQGLHTLWRWTCGCSQVKTGRWQGESPGVSYHDWLLHCSRSRQGLR